MKYLSTFLSLVTCMASGQLSDQSIMEPINNLFVSMEKGDSTLAHSAFFKDAILVTVLEREGDISLRKETLNPFLEAIASPRQVQWSEPIWEVKINQDGNFAQVWANYAFFLGNKFSHCGVDTFQLVKTGTGWKIFYLADTRKKVGCAVPDAITKQYSK